MTDLDTQDTGITFLRSTTTTWVDIERDGDTATKVKHLARFAVRDHAIPDLVHRYGSKVFSPRWLEVTWLEGTLNHVILTGPPRLKSGGVSEKALSLSTEWSAYDLAHQNDTGARHSYAMGPLPEAVAAMVELYQKRVVVGSSSPTAPFL